MSQVINSDANPEQIKAANSLCVTPSLYSLTRRPMPLLPTVAGTLFGRVNF
jgi:hypothetical protein